MKKGEDRKRKRKRERERKEEGGIKKTTEERSKK